MLIFVSLDLLPVWEFNYDCLIVDPDDLTFFIPEAKYEYDFISGVHLIPRHGVRRCRFVIPAIPADIFVPIALHYRHEKGVEQTFSPVW